MSELPTNQAVDNGNGKQSQGLTCIRGIGSTKKKWLESLGIKTIYALAQVTVVELREQLKEIGYIVSQSEVEGWVKQAQILTNYIPSKSSFPEVELDQECPKAIAFDVPPPSTAQPRDEWNTVTGFNIEVQTREVNGIKEQRTLIQQLETGIVESWAGIAEDPLHQWLHDRLTETLEANGGAIVASAEPIAIDIAEIRIFQAGLPDSPMVAGKADPLMADSLVTNVPFAVELTVGIAADAIANSTNKSIVYHAKGQARHLATGEVTDLGETRITVQLQDAAKCTILLPQITLEKPGAYRLLAFASIENFASVTGYFKVPLLQLQSATPANYQVEDLQMSCGI
ncbi:MAG: hypothetical protein IGS48_09620 [Oscillatoriales cyanobacterium C42_A2020_001]|nr:hypothetical protein [Leptolyngbyaceae cyanobacterium C42_A2020_001]